MRQLMMFLFLALTLPVFASQPPKALHAIIAVDTKGFGIQKASEADLEHMEKSLCTIAHHLRLVPHILVLKDNECSVDCLKSAVVSLKGYSEDVVVFLYSGHGNMDPDKSPWPVMYPAAGDTHKGLRSSSVVSFFKKNRHRFAVLLFDCCNKSISSGPYDAVPKGAVPVMTMDDLLPGLKNLFLSSRGMVIGSAASRLLM
jgi:hypothetical protein